MRYVVAVAGFLVFSLTGPALAQDRAERTQARCGDERTTAERTICRDRRLTRLDVRLNKLYKAARAEMNRSDRRELLDVQRAWLKRRNRCRRNTRCLENRYRTRIEDLAALSNNFDGGRNEDPFDDEDGFEAEDGFQDDGANQNTVEKCKGEGQYRSLAGVEKTIIVFRSRARSEEDSFNVYWLNYRGRRKLYKTLFPGDRVRLNTYLSHPWLITSPVPGGGEVCVATYWPTRGTRRVTLR